MSSSALAAQIAALPPGYLEEYNGTGIVVSISIFIGIMIVVIALRFWAKILSRSKLGADDWLMIPSLIAGITAGACCIAMVNYGGAGYHMIAVAMDDPGKIVIFAKLIIAFATFYLMGMSLPKISILCMYLRIFVEPWQRKACYILMAVLAATSFADIIANWNLCTPLAYFWDKTIEGGHCIDVNAYWRWGTFSNILTDIAMVLLPIPAVWKLQLSFKDKVGVAGVFAVGGIGLIASCLRFAAFYSVDGASSNADSTFATSIEAIYSILEITVYIVCACLPSYRSFYLYLRKSRNTTKPRGSKTGGSTMQSWRKPRANASYDDDHEIPLSGPFGNQANSKFQRLGDNASEKSAEWSYDSAGEKSVGDKSSGIAVRSEYKVTREKNRSAL